MTAPTRQKFLPRPITCLVDRLGSLPLAGGGDDSDAFDAVAELASALYHFEFHDREQTATALWDEASGGGDDAPDGRTALSRSLAELLEDSNYRRMSMDEVEDAMAREMLIPLRLEVDLDDYREVLIYRRGTRQEPVEIRTWGGLRRSTRIITTDSRLVVHTHVRSQEWFSRRGIDPAERGLTPGQITLKHFRDVPRANIKSLFPSVRVRFRPIDSLLLGVPALASGLVVLLTKLLTTLGLLFVFIGAWLGLRSKEPTLDQGAMVALFGGLAALGGFLVRQWTKLKNRRVKYLKVLTEHLYHHTIGDGPDVVHSLMYSAERQEVAEVLIAYRFLLAAPRGRRIDELDAEIESWLHHVSGLDIDFDVGDAVTKLISLRLATIDESAPTDDSPPSPEARLHARPLGEVRRALNRRWDDLFTGDEHVPVTKQR